MTFKDFLQSDTAVFINLDEFGEIVNLDGAEISAVVTYSTTKLKNDKPSSIHKIAPSMHARNLVGNSLTIHFKTAEYLAARGRIPKQSEFITFNGKRLKVQEAVTLEGITRLICSKDSMNLTYSP